MSAIAKIAGNVGKSLMKVKPIAKLAVKAGKNKPELMAISGGVSIIAAFILAIKAGTKVKETMADTSAAVEAIEAGRAQKLAIEGLSEEEKAQIINACNKDLKMARADGVWQMTKLFILPTGMLFVGLALMGKGHQILKKRNVVLATAMKGLDSKFKSYRNNVKSDLGEEADLKYLRGMTGEVAESERTITDENGKTKKIKKKFPVVHHEEENLWRFIFDEDHFNTWVNNSESNLWFLKQANEYWNHKYESGHNKQGISMYDILTYLQYNFDIDRAGMTRTQYRDWITFLRNWGWKKGNGDDYIDFGLYQAINEPAMLRKTDDIFIEFNCAGSLQEMV